MLPFQAVVSSGDLRPRSHEGVEFQHRWTDGGVVVECDFNGGDLLHLAIAGCVLNDVHREAERLGVRVDGVRVAATGDLDRETWRSQGISYQVEVSSSADDEDIERLLQVVDDVAEIPKAFRSGGPVQRT
ncbi:MAG: OsmC family peroxiredoxin [Actinobacteria bacterium]|nr:MAG: OsmC family peroxiredoxin [Actinomycetota bacterium]REK40484.1 MAG: OsmC family peroxiredoxin [Actinomycetota bacterium]